MDYLHKKAEADALKYLVEKENTHIHKSPLEKDSKYEIK